MLQRHAHLGIRLKVQGGEVVVEDVDPRPAHQGPGDGEPLLLAPGQVGPALRDERVVSAVELFDKLRGLGRLGGVTQLVVCGLGPAVAQVFPRPCR